MAGPTYGHFDQWRNTAQADLAEARGLAARVELRARSADQVAARAAYLDLLGIRPRDRVLEVGCGSGAVLRDLAQRVGPAGQAVGLDYSPALLTVARELSDQAGLDDRIELCGGDARVLPFGDAVFDVVLAATSLCHVPEGERALPELARVARPGGRVGVFARDTDSLIVTHPDRALTRRIVSAWSDHGAVNGWLGRRLPLLLTEVGLRDVRARAFTPLDMDPSSYYLTVITRLAADVARQAGAISEQEWQAWLDALRAEQAVGPVIAGLTHLFVWGTRPPL